MMAQQTSEDNLMKFWAGGLVQKPSENDTTAPPDSSARAKAAREFGDSLEGMKNILKDALNRNKNMYTMLIVVNLVIVGIGVAFVIISIGHSVLNNTIDQITLASAGLAVADFVAIFLVNPQDRMKKSLTNFVQLGILSHSWSSRTQACFVLFLKSEMKQDDVKLFQTTIDEIADDTVVSIEDKVEK